MMNYHENRLEEGGGVAGDVGMFILQEKRERDGKWEGGKREVGSRSLREVEVEREEDGRS
jgi:hypothetical protein